MKKYKSKFSTKEKKELFNLFEKHKYYGTIPVKPINKYIQKKKYKIYTGTRGKERRHFDIYNKKGTHLVSGGFNKKNRINMWAIR